MLLQGQVFHCSTYITYDEPESKYGVFRFALLLIFSIDQYSTDRTIIRVAAIVPVALSIGPPHFHQIIHIFVNK